MKKALISLLIFSACNTEPKEVEQPKVDNTMDSLLKYSDSLKMDMYDFEKAKADSALKQLTNG